MITIDDKEYRNLQEQVGYLTEELKKLKQSLGSALPEPIEGPQGPQGETGATGPQGRSPKIGFGFGPLPDDETFQDGDIYIARGTVNGLTKGNMYKKVNGNWELQLNVVGPQGPVGPLNTNEVVANPDEAPSDTLYKVDIDGVIYEVLDENKRNSLSHISDHTLFLDFNKLAQFSAGVALKSSLEFGVNANMKMLQNSNYFKILSLSKIVDNSNNPIVICENFNDSHGNARFVEGTCEINDANFSGTVTYNKWSLSGTHLMIVIAGTINAGDYSTDDLFLLTTSDIPSWILNKISPVSLSYIEFKQIELWVDWNITYFDLEIKKGDYLSIAPSHAQTVSANSKFRLQLDYLIDMDENNINSRGHIDL